VGEREAALALACTGGVGPATASALRTEFGSYAAAVLAVLRGDPRAAGVPAPL